MQLSRPIKILLVALGAIAGACVLMAFCLWLFVKALFHSNGCVNIDNIELHTHIDIPEHDGGACNYDSERNIKMARFHLDTSVRMLHYIDYNKLLPLRTGASFDYNDLIGFDRATAGRAHFFYSQGSLQKGEHWKALLDTNTRNLWVTVYFKK